MDPWSGVTGTSSSPGALAPSCAPGGGGGGGGAQPCATCPVLWHVIAPEGSKHLILKLIKLQFEAGSHMVINTRHQQHQPGLPEAGWVHAFMLCMSNLTLAHHVTQQKTRMCFFSLQSVSDGAEGAPLPLKTGFIWIYFFLKAMGT